VTDSADGVSGSSPEAALGEGAPPLIDGRFEILDVLDEGAMGTVYKVRHARLGALFAMKVLRAPRAGLPMQPPPGKEALTRFDREAQILGKLSSDHIVKVTDCGARADGSPYLVMELLEGSTLAHVLEAGFLSVSRGVTVCIQICRGLSRAHDANIVHRDLKPANIFLTRDEADNELVKILDFGVAKLLDREEQASVTQADTAVGTPLYMSPEQVSGASDVDQRADIYAVGAILYQLLAGRPPHPGTNPKAVMAAILTAEPEPLNSLRPDLPPALVRVVHGALSKRRADRPATAQRLERALAPFATSRIDALSPRADPAARTLDERASADSTSSIVGAARPTRTAGATTAVRWRVVAGVVSALILAAIGWLARGGQRPAETELVAPTPAAAPELRSATGPPVVAPVAAPAPEPRLEAPKPKPEPPRGKHAPPIQRARVPLRPLQGSSH
jgi:eukaryotic-like serine/threonine-protein kinase